MDGLAQGGSISLSVVVVVEVLWRGLELGDDRAEAGVGALGAHVVRAAAARRRVLPGREGRAP